MTIGIRLPSIGMSAAQTLYQQYEAAAIQAARANNASLWYVGNDPTGFVWQDSAGTVPATGTDPIGLLLDRQYGASNLGVDLSSPFSLWTNASIGTGTAVASGTDLAITSVDGLNAGKRTLSITTVSGGYYRVSIAVKAGGSGGELALEIAGAFAVSMSNGSTRTYMFQASGVSTLIGLRITGNAGSRTVESCVVQQVLGIPAIQPTAANKPTLELQANGYFGMRFDGANDALATTLTSGSGAITFGAAFNTGSLANRTLTGSTGVTYAAASNSIKLRSNGDIWLLRDGPATTPTAVGGYSANTPCVVSAKITATGVASLWTQGALRDSKASTWAPNTNPWILGDAGNGEFMGGLVQVFWFSQTDMSDADRIAIERFAALLSGASYA